MDQIPYPGPGVLFHVRMVILFIILAAVDVVALGVAMNTIFTEGVGGTVLFANEVSTWPIRLPGVLTHPQYAILLASALNSIAKYCINIIEFRHARANGGETAPPWENKSMYLFYIELCTGVGELCCSWSWDIMLTRHRLHEAHNLPSVLLADNREARPPFEHDSGCIHHRSLIRHPIPRTHSIPLRYAGYGSSLSQRHGSGAGRHVRQDLHHLSRRTCSSRPAGPGAVWPQHYTKETPVWTHFPLQLSQVMARATAELPYLVSLRIFARI